MLNEQRVSQTVNVMLWIVQLLLAAMLIWSGTMKIFNPASLPWPWIKENPGLATFTGVPDLLAALGLVLPAWLRIRPRLTLYAAYGVMSLMIAAMIFHISRGEGAQTGFNIFMLICSAFVAWGRSRQNK